jgi:sugar lactone lactonase YvrE
MLLPTSWRRGPGARGRQPKQALIAAHLDSLNGAAAYREVVMQRTLHFLFLASLALVPATPAQAWIRSPATTFATLPADATPPEGITTDAAGNVYVSTFGFPESGESAAPGRILVYSPQGTLLRQFVVAGASAHLLGMGVNPATHQLLVADFGHGQVLNVDPVSGTSTVFADIGAACTGDCANPLSCPPPAPSPGPGLNAIAFDAAGNVFISDSFGGIIWMTDKNGAGLTKWASDPLLATCGKPPFGANGLAFNNQGTALFVANTGDDAVIEIPVVGGVGGAAGAPTVFAYSINGADGLVIDASDNVWVAANQADEIVVLDVSGKAIAKLGDFNGVDNQGAVRGLLFPASLVFSGNFVLVTNLALDTRLFGFPTVDAEWAALVTRYTVSKINRQLPSISPNLSAPGHGPAAGNGPPAGHGR